MYKNCIKRLFDITFSLVAISMLLALMMVISLLISLQSKSIYVIYIQKRVGKNSKNFNILKFKTMSDAKDNNGNLLPDKDRITPIGKFIRATSIDEIPQLFNVLKGDMSLIGPRPLLVEYLPLYSKEQSRRHEVRPGITGWAQVNGRNAISWQQKFTYDVWYVDNISFFLDMKILFLTLKKVIKRSDINSATSATMEKFNGNN